MVKATKVTRMMWTINTDKAHIIEIRMAMVIVQLEKVLTTTERFESAQDIGASTLRYCEKAKEPTPRMAEDHTQQATRAAKSYQERRSSNGFKTQGGN